MQIFWYKQSSGLRLLNVALIAGVLELPVMHVLIYVFMKPFLMAATVLEILGVVAILVIWRSMYRLPHVVTDDQITLRCGLLKTCCFDRTNIASITPTAGEKLSPDAAYRAYILRPGQMLLTFKTPVPVKGWWTAKSYPAVQFDADQPDEFIAAVVGA
jgi:hypothetical protein